MRTALIDMFYILCGCQACVLLQPPIEHIFPFSMLLRKANTQTDRKSINTKVITYTACSSVRKGLATYMSVPGTTLCRLIFRPINASRDSSVGRAEDCSWKYQIDILRSVVQIRLARTFSFCSHFSWKTSAARPPKRYVQSFNAMGIHLNEWLLSQCKQYWHLTHSFMCLTFPYTLFRAEKPPVADNRSTLHGDVGCFGFTSPYFGL